MITRYAIDAGSSSRQVHVIGAGLSGMAAALQAQADGANVTVLDKMPQEKAGGNSQRAAGAFLMPNEDTAHARRDFVESLLKNTAGKGSQEFFALIAEHMYTDISWLREIGAGFLPPYRCAPPYRCSVLPLSPGQFIGTPALMPKLTDVFVRRGGRIAYEAKAVQLLTTHYEFSSRCQSRDERQRATLTSEKPSVP